MVLYEARGALNAQPRMSWKNERGSESVNEQSVCIDLIQFGN